MKNVIIVGAVAVFAAGCSGSSSSSSSSGSSGTSTTTTSSTGSASSGSSTGSSGSSTGSTGSSGSTGGIDCSAPSLAGAPTIVRNSPTGNPPAATGGPITDGTYFETSEDDYNGQSIENSTQRVVVFDQAHGTWRMAATDGTNMQAVAGALTVTSPAFTIDANACGTNATLTIQYTATSTTVSWIDPNHPNRIQNFTKQ
ncbi:MAG: hypothetical protein JST54_13455 [Deltaproteobacteria bacterium]|nr:hypothetical protein [Deltaproteobacteria bacterium]